MIKPIFSQDDCAPDALETFNERLKKETGFDVWQFKNNDKTTAINLEGGYSTYWMNGDYVLEIHADDPYYALYSLQDKKDFLLKTIEAIKINYSLES